MFIVSIMFIDFSAHVGFAMPTEINWPFCLTRMNFLPSSWDRDSVPQVQRLSTSEFSQNFREKLCRDFVAKISNISNIHRTCKKRATQPYLGLKDSLTLCAPRLFLKRGEGFGGASSVQWQRDNVLAKREPVSRLCDSSKPTPMSNDCSTGTAQERWLGTCFKHSLPKIRYGFYGFWLKWVAGD